MENSLKELEATSSDSDLHIKIWAESLIYFRKNGFLLYNNKTFDESQLKPEIIDFLLKANIKIQKISDTL